jgi:hypothetical protein
MNVTLALAFAVFQAGVPLPDDADDPGAVVVRLRCPNAADLAACKRLFDHPEVLSKAVQCYWVAALPVVKKQKDSAAWLKRRLRVITSGGDTIRISIRGSMSKRERAALANAVFFGWAYELGGSGFRMKLADIATERRAYDKVLRQQKAAHRHFNEAMSAPREDGPAGKLARAAAVEAAVAEARALRPACDAAEGKLGEVARIPPFVIVHLARGPRSPGLETMGAPPHGR